MDDTLGGSPDFLVISQPGEQDQKVAVPRVMGQLLRIGREGDNDVVLTDSRVSRYHSHVRRGARGLEIMDVGSANGTLLGSSRIPANTWQPFARGTLVYVGDTRLRYEPSVEHAETLAMAPLSAPTREPELQQAPLTAPSQGTALATWLLLAGAVGIVAILILAAIMMLPGAEQEPAAPAVAPTFTLVLPIPGTPGQPPTAVLPAPTATVQQIPYPVLSVEAVSAQPIILGALPDPTQALIVVRVRVENQGTGDLTLSPEQFELFDTSGLVMKEIGGTYSSDGLRKMGLADRYQGLILGAGDSAPESLLFSGKAQHYQLFLRYEPLTLGPIVLDLGDLDAAREVALALGTPITTPEPIAVAAVTATPSPWPTPTPTRPASLPAPKTVPKSALVGTLAYPVFNGTTYDIYLARIDGSERRMALSSSSQPQFSRDGKRIAYHSWQQNKRGLITADVTGGNEHIIAANLEDQLPTWSPDGAQIIFLSRRSGQRASELFAVSSTGGEARVIGNGEYPTWGPDGRLAFKGWVATGVGLRQANSDLTDMTPLTDQDTDTAPAASPDGTQIAFMSRRDGNWNIYLVRSDGTALKQLTDDPAEDGLPAWSPDGKVIAFVSNRGGPWAVWVIAPQSGAERQVFTMEGPPDGFVSGEDRDKSRGWAEERISWTR